MKLIKIVQYLFYLLIFVLPWQTRLIYQTGELNGGFWEYGTKALYGTEILVVVIFILIISQIIISIKGQKIVWQIRPLDCFILGLIVFVLLSTFWSIDCSQTLYYFSLLIEGLALFYLASRLGFKFKLLSYSFVFSGLIQSILAIQQFLTQMIYGNKWLGMASQNATDLGVSTVEGAGRFMRAYGSLPHPNMLGGWLTICIIFLIGLLFQYQKRFYHAPWKVSKALIGQAIFLFSSLAIMTYGLVLSFSRSAWIGLIVAIIFIWIILVKRRQKDLLRFYLRLNLIILLVVVLFSMVYGQLLVNRVSVESRLEVQSIDERVQGYGQAWDIFKSHAFLGVGLGNYTGALYNVDSTRPAWEYQPVHNIDLLTMSELGIVGESILIGIFLCILLIIFKNWYAEVGENKLILVSAALGVVVIAGFDHYLWSLYFGILLFWLILGLSIREE
ncbi:MAG: O-antigen ligase family protein [Candidatus Komeilibacteria bacterium]